MTRLMLTAVALAVSGAVLAKIPPPVLDEAAKAKAAEAAAKTAYTAKLEAYQMCKAQDRVVANYRKNHPNAAKPAGAASGTAAAPMPPASMTTAAAKPAPGASAAAPAASATVAASKTAPTSASASQGGSTPVAAAPTPTGCADPGPFAYAPPEQKPLETSGAHSPAANATSPPSVRSDSAQMAPAKAGTTSKP